MWTGVEVGDEGVDPFTLTLSQTGYHSPDRTLKTAPLFTLRSPTGSKIPIRYLQIAGLPVGL